MPYRQVCHEHCPKGGGGAALLVVLVIIVVAAVARPVEHAAEIVAEVAIITAASLAGLAVLAGAAFAAVRVHRSRARKRQAIARHAPTAQALSVRPVAAIEASRAIVVDGAIVSDETAERVPDTP